MKHGKQYKTQHEEAERYAVFISNYQYIANHNVRYEQGLESFYLKINQRADLTMDEMRQLNGFKRTVPPIEVVHFKAPNHTIPQTFDWTKKGAVTAVKDQLFCASGWTFSTVSIK